VPIHVYRHHTACLRWTSMLDLAMSCDIAFLTAREREVQYMGHGTCRLGAHTPSLRHQSPSLIYAAPLYCRPTRQPRGAYVSAKPQPTRFHHFHTPNRKATITIDLLAVSHPATCLITAPCLTYPSPMLLSPGLELYHFGGMACCHWC